MSRSSEQSDRLRERDDAIRVANAILDRRAADPDDDLNILARQFVRADEAANTYDEQLAVATWNDALDSAGAAVDALAQSHGGRNPLLAYTDIIEALFSQRRIVAALDTKAEAKS